MMSIFRTLTIATVCTFLLSCGSSDSSDSENKKEEVTKESIKQQIKETEEAVEAAKGEAAMNHSARLAEILKSYANHFPKDSLTPEMLFKSANVHITVKKYDRCLSTLNRIREHYGHWEKIPETIFMQGFVNDYHLGRKGKAVGYYEELLEKYPDHTFAKDARASIKNIGKTDEELIREFEAKRKKEQEAAKEES